MEALLEDSDLQKKLKVPPSSACDRHPRGYGLRDRRTKNAMEVVVYTGIPHCQRITPDSQTSQRTVAATGAGGSRVGGYMSVITFPFRPLVGKHEKSLKKVKSNEINQATQIPARHVRLSNRHRK